MKFGGYDCFSLDLGTLNVDGGAMFGVVPKTLWEKKIPADKNNRIPMRVVSLLIIGKKKNIIVDTGFGNKLPEKQKEIYGICNYVGFDESLSKHGISPGDITDVFITHLHFDHTGGSTIIQENRIVPTFPNAVYHIQKNQWEAANNPNIRDRSSYIKDNFIPLKSSGLLKLTDGQEDIFEDIDIIVTEGHTPGQQHLLIKGENESLFHCADLFPTSAHLPISWHMAYDIKPLIIMQEKELFLKRAMQENWVLFFGHDPDITAAHVKQKGGNIIIADTLIF